MGESTRLAPEQLHALDRLAKLPEAGSLHLVGGSAVAFHFGHRRDLAAMKLAAIARRGIRRDFWDLYVIARSGLTLATMARDYVRKFGREESDLYHVLRALTYFADAESDPLFPRGMTPELWKEIKDYFEHEAPLLLIRDE